MDATDPSNYKKRMKRDFHRSRSRALLVAASASLLFCACGEDPATTTSSGADATTGGDAAGPGADALTADAPKGGPDLPDTSGPNGPPQLSRVGDRIVAVDESLSIVVEATDPDGDTLSYSVYGKLPEGARFSKADRRFEWTPTEAPQKLFLTFVVTDGREFDRETIRIEVVSEKTGHPPLFEAVGDQVLRVGEEHLLQLVATDPDGDPLTYGHEGPLPQGAALDAYKGLFRWVPDAASAGRTERVTFTVSDGQLSAKVDVNLLVGKQGGGDAEPPIFEPTAPQTVLVGATLELTLKAVDANGDAITYGVYGGAPPTATLDGATFRYTATAEDAGIAWAVTFSATDGVLTAFTTVDITVVRPAGVCEDDPFEPNGTIEFAKPVIPGTYEAGICDNEGTPVDRDIYAVDVGANQQLVGTITFDPELGDLDLRLVDGAGTILQTSEGVTATESVTYPGGAAPTTVYLVVDGYGSEKLAVPYTLVAGLEAVEVCVADGFEPNETFATGKPLPASDTSLSICPGDRDVWAVGLTCGETATLTLDTGGTGDLDMGLWGPTATLEDAPLASAATEDPIEVLTFGPAEQSAIYRLLVVGYPAATGKGTYKVSSVKQGACVEDALGVVDSVASAAMLQGLEGQKADLRVCCRADWFKITLGQGDELVVDTSVAGQGSLGLTVFEPDGATQLAAKPPEAGGAIVQVTTGEPGTYYVKTYGQAGTAYTLEWLVTPPAVSGCTGLSCETYDVCDAASGSCVSDYCDTDQECPGGHVCRDTYCMNPCTADADCRAVYACKAFADGRYCGVTGQGAAGDSCFAFASCAGAAICTFTDKSGYCAAEGCQGGAITCGEGTQCVAYPGGDGSLCAKSCASTADCRSTDGYACSMEDGTCLPE